MNKLFETVFHGKNGDFKVLKKEGQNCEVIFLETGYKKKVNIRYIKDGSNIVNKGNASVLGIGIVGKDFKTQLEKELYQTWRQMLKRCYAKDYAASHKKNNITVCENWKNFIIFEKEIKEIDGWSEELFLKKEIILDKDKKRRAENCVATQYNKKNCSWITKKENALYTTKSKKIKATKKDKIIIANSIKEMSRKLKINEKTVAKYLNSTYLEWKIEEIKIKR